MTITCATSYSIGPQTKIAHGGQQQIHLVWVGAQRLFTTGMQYLLAQRPSINWIAEFDSGTALFKALHANALSNQWSNAPHSVIVLCTDIEDMPLIACIQRLKRTIEKTTILILADEGNPLSAYYYREAGADGYIAKTVTEEQFIAALTALAQKPSPTDTNNAQATTDIKTSIPNTTFLDRLSLREREVFLALAQGKTSREIANTWHRSQKTVSCHKISVFKKLGITSTRELFFLSVRLGLRAPQHSCLKETTL